MKKKGIVMKNYYVIGLLFLGISSVITATDRNVIYHLPDRNVLDAAFKTAGLTDFIQNSKLIESIQSHQIYPSEIGSFIQQAYRTYYTYLDSWSPNVASEFSMIPVPALGNPPLAAITQSVAAWYRNIFNKMYIVIQNRQFLYQTLLHDYPSELLRLKDLGIISSITPAAPTPQALSYNAWSDPYGLDEDEVEPQPTQLRDDEEAQRLPESVLYKIGSEQDQKYQLALPTAQEIQDYQNKEGQRELQSIYNYFTSNRRGQDDINKDMKMSHDIQLHNRLTKSNFLEKLTKVTIHPTEIGSFVEMLYAQEFDDIYNFNTPKNVLMGATFNALSYVPPFNPPVTALKNMSIQQEWLPAENQYKLYEMLLKNMPSALTRLEDLGVYNSLHEVAGYL